MWTHTNFVYKYMKWCCLVRSFTYGAIQCYVYWQHDIGILKHSKFVACYVYEYTFQIQYIFCATKNRSTTTFQFPMHEYFKFIATLKWMSSLKIISLTIVWYNLNCFLPILWLTESDTFVIKFTPETGVSH